jgi:hypothetical protein
MASEMSGEEQAKAAREALREIEKLKLKFEAEEGAGSHFLDEMVNAVLLVSDLAGDALSRDKGPKPKGD